MKRQILVALLLLAARAVWAQACLPSSSASGDNLSNIEIGSLPASSDGLIHVTYGFNDNVDQNTQNLFGNAVQQWNAVKGTTGVVFEPAPAGQTSNISMALNPGNSAGCIAITASSGSIAYNAGWQQLEANDPITATASIAHEIGHFLGLADAGPNPSQPTIMNNPFQGFCADSQLHTTSVQASDATNGEGCMLLAQVVQNPPPPPHHRPCLVDGNPCDPCDPECTPIIIDTEGEGFHLTSAVNGVKFDISGNGIPIQISWTDSHFHNAFLALPGQDGLVHSGKELFGNFTTQPPSSHPNGFLALAEFDKPENGGNSDGLIDERDAVYSRLRLWIDENHDAVAQPNELHTLEEMGVYSLNLNYSKSPKRDQYGNAFRYKARVNSADRRDYRDERQHGEGNEVGRWAYDVILVIADK